MSSKSSIVSLILMLVALRAFAQNNHVHFREWIAKNGSMKEAALESIDLDRSDPFVSIKLRSGKTVDVKFDALSNTDQTYVRIQQINAEDREQFELVADHIEALRTTPKSVAGILQQISKTYKLAPYASVWCGIAFSAGDNKPDKGIIVIREAIKRIAEQRELDASRHSRTLSAAYNNLGVCLIKQRDGDSAAGHFVSALEELDYVPPILAHNINHLLEMKDKPNGLKLDHKSTVSLQSAMAGRRVLEPRKKMQQGWYYSLDLDVPSSLESELSVAGVLSPDPTLELIASGTGIVVAPGYVLTVRSAVTHPDRSAFLTTVGVPLDLKISRSKSKGSLNQWRQLPVRRLIVTQPEKMDVGGTDSVAVTTSDWTTNSFSSSDTSSSEQSVEATISGVGVAGSSTLNQASRVRGSTTDSNTRGTGITTGVANSRSVSNSTNYIVIHPKDGPEKELAVLQIDGLRTRPIVFSHVEVPANQRFGISSFERGPGMLTTGLKTSTGKVYGIGNLESELKVDIPFNGGQRGAALFDSAFLVLGLACSTISGRDGVALSSQSIKVWFEQNVKAASLTFADEDSPKLAMKDVAAATIPIFVWGKRSETELQNPLYNQFFNDDNLVEMHVLRDQYCIACRGKGNVPCVQCKGQGTVQNGIKQVQTGVNPRTGQPLMVNVPNMVRCPTCNGGSRHGCPICKGIGENPGGPTP